MPLILQLVTLYANPGCAPAILKHLQRIRDESYEKEPGTTKYFPAQTEADENIIHVWEEFEDEDALNVHRKNAALQEFYAERDQLVARPFHIQRCKKY